MTNLLEETLYIMKQNGVSPEDELIVVMDNAHFCYWKDFVAVAENYNYDSDYGFVEVNEHLKIAGADWWMERHEYDGCEWWEFKRHPKLGSQRYTNQIDLRCDWDRCAEWLEDED